MLSLRDKIIKDVADDLEIDESICDKVVAWVYEDTIKATNDVNSIELAGFGTLRVSQNKLKKRIQRFEKIKTGSQLKLQEGNTKANWETRLKGLEEVLEFLKMKLK
jgi:nucleoid DNA-binding protein